MVGSSVVFACAAAVLDRWYETGQGCEELPRWLFAANPRSRGTLRRPSGEGEGARGADVAVEEERTRESMRRPVGERAPVLIHQLQTVYRQWRRPDKVAVDGLTLHVEEQE